MISAARDSQTWSTNRALKVFTQHTVFMKSTVRHGTQFIIPVRSHTWEKLLRRRTSMLSHLILVCSLAHDVISTNPNLHI